MQPPPYGPKPLSLLREMVRLSTAGNISSERIYSRSLLKSFLREPYFKDIVRQLEDCANLPAEHPRAISREAALAVAQDTFSRVKKLVAAKAGASEAIAAAVVRLRKQRVSLSFVLDASITPNKASQDYVDDLRNKVVRLRFRPGYCQVIVLPAASKQ